VGARVDSMNENRTTLDNLLPLLEPTSGSAVLHVAVVEVRDAADLAGLASDPRMGRFLLGRLSDTVALVDPGAEEAFLVALRDAGHTPKRTKDVGP